MVKPQRYYVDFSVLFVEAKDEYEADRIISQALEDNPQLIQVCNVDEYDD